MEFWGVEVKPGEPLKVQPEFGKLIHISQAAIGEVKDVKAAKYVPLRLKVNNKNYVIGALSAEDRPQLMFDLVFEGEFELSHGWKNGSVYFAGYVADDPDADLDGFDDSMSEEEYALPEFEEQDKQVKSQDTQGKKADAKPGSLAVKDAKSNKEESESDEDGSDDDDDEDEAEGPSDDDLNDISGDSGSESDESMDGSDSSDEESPKAPSKKRSADALETPVPTKKAKSATPDKTGKKGGHTDTPYPVKKGGNTPASNKPKNQSPKANGQFSHQSNNKKFGSKNAPKGKQGRK